MLDDTLVVGGGELAARRCRRAMAGSSHQGFGFLLAGGGIRGGITYGAAGGTEPYYPPLSLAEFSDLLRLLTSFKSCSNAGSR
jgi:hypothetical protein